MNHVLDRVSTVENLKCILPLLLSQADDKNALIAAAREKARNLAPSITEDELTKLLGHVTQGTTTHALAKPCLNLADGLVQFSNDPPPPRNFAIQDVLLAGKSALIAGLGGVSKSQMLLQMVVCCALGLPFMGQPTKPCAALLVSSEDDTEEVSRRINAIVKVFKLTEDQLELLRQRLRVFPMVGQDIRLTSTAGGSLLDTGFAQQIAKTAEELEAVSGLPVGLIGLDHLGMLHGGDFNAREDAVQTMRLVNRICQETSAAVVVLAHSPKAAMTRDEANGGDVAGSAAFVDHARGVYVLRTMDVAEAKRYAIDADARKNYVALVNVKANYTANGGVIWMQRCVVEGYETSVLHKVDLREPEKIMKGGGNFKLRAAIFELVQQKPYLTKESLLGFSGKEGSLRASRQMVLSELEMMLAEGILNFRPPSDDERKRLGIKGSTRGFLTTVKAS